MPGLYVSFPARCDQCGGAIELLCSMNDDEHVDEVRTETYGCPYCKAPNTLEIAGKIERVVAKPLERDARPHFIKPS